MNDLSELNQHMQLFDSILGVHSRNRETLFDYNFGRDTRPSSQSPGREFFHVLITTRNHNNNPIKLSWFYHSNYQREFWFMTSISMKGLGLDLDLNVLNSLHKLEYLDLQGNIINHFNSKFIINCRNLHTINLSGCSMSKINLEGLNCYNLGILDLSANELKQFDINYLKEMYLIKKLYLQNNRLDFIDLSVINNFKLLVSLDISHNDLKSITISLESEYFHNLFVNDNQLTHLEITHPLMLKNLSVVVLNNNLLTDITQIISELPSIKKISSFGNRIDSVKLNSHNVLEELNLSMNPLISVEITGSFENLRKLDLSYTDINKLDLTTNDMPSLETLNLSCTELKSFTLPESITPQFIDFFGSSLIEFKTKLNLEVVRQFTIGNYTATEYTTTQGTRIQLPWECKVIQI